MQYKVISNCCYRGKGYQKGDVLECSENDAQLLIGMGRIKESKFIESPQKVKMKKEKKGTILK